MNCDIAVSVWCELRYSGVDLVRAVIVIREACSARGGRCGQGYRGGVGMELQLKSKQQNVSGVKI